MSTSLQYKFILQYNIAFRCAGSSYDPSQIQNIQEEHISMAPTTMKALKSVSEGKAEVQEVPLPRLRDDYILVKVKAVALNPTDW